MNTLLTLTVPYLVPLLSIIIGWAVHHFMVYLPAEQRNYISSFVKKAVMMVEQLGEGKTNAEKKQMAIDIAVRFFTVFKLPIPPIDVLSAFIEAAVKEISDIQVIAVSKKSSPASIDPGMLIDPQKFSGGGQK